jgi:transposase
MLALSNRYRYFLYYGKADFRKGFNGLSGMVRNEMGLDPTDGEIYVFVNRRRNQLKLLLFEPDGFCLYHKKLSEGTFEIPLYDAATGSAIISEEQLSLILKGISLSSVRKRKRYHFKRA